MDLEKIYHDLDDNECNILQLVKKEPEWAANRIQEGEKAIKILDTIRIKTEDETLKNCVKAEDKPRECFMCNNRMQYPLIERQEMAIYWCSKCGSIEILDKNISKLKKAREIN